VATPQGGHARRLILDGFRGAGAEPAGTDGYFQAIPVSRGVNVMTLVPGRGPQATRTILVAAHYDHLGQGFGQTYWGADDNAAGVAVLLDLANRLMDRRAELRRSVLLCAFDAEEPPFFLSAGMGSMYFVARPTVPLERIDMMICLDLIGHALGPPGLPSEIRDSIFCAGAEQSTGTGPMVDAVASGRRGLHVRRLDSHIVPPLSDHYAFERAMIPSLFFTCGRGEWYHTPADTPETLDYDTIAAVGDFLLDLVVELSRRPGSEVELLAGARDDHATVDTLVRMVESLPETLPLVEAARESLQGLSRRIAADGPLSDEDLNLLRAIAMGLEAGLGRLE
jgi:hypothetical protein